MSDKFAAPVDPDAVIVDAEIVEDAATPTATPTTDDAAGTADPTYDFVPVAAPVIEEYQIPVDKPGKGDRARMRKGSVALVLVGSLALGAVGGAAAYWAIDQYAPSEVAPPVAGPQLPQGDGAPVAENAISQVVAASMPSVVQIEVSSDGTPASTGSGLVIREDGYILTNNHVIDQPNPGVTVVFSDGTEEPAEIIGSTADYDLAVLKVDREGLTPLVLGDSDLVAVGDPVIAIGSPLGLDSTVTTGIISALHRPVTTSGEGSQAFIDALQTDAAINPGNSGGPLLNARGEVIGINSAVASLPGATQATGAGSVGLGFAIPSNQARHTAEQLIDSGIATYPVIGVILDGAYQGEGVKVAEFGMEEGQPGVVPGGPADRAGIREGDVIVGFQGRPVTNADNLIVGIRALAPGDTVTFTILRDGEKQDVTVLLKSSDEVDFTGSDDAGVGGRGESPAE